MLRWRSTPKRINLQHLFQIHSHEKCHFYYLHIATCYNNILTSNQQLPNTFPGFTFVCCSTSLSSIGFRHFQWFLVHFLHQIKKGKLIICDLSSLYVHCGTQWHKHIRKNQYGLLYPTKHWPDVVLLSSIVYEAKVTSGYPLLAILFTFSTTWSCASLPRSTTSSGWIFTYICLTWDQSFANRDVWKLISLSITVIW